MQAFSALAKSPELCSYVKELEVRVYPLASQHRLDELQEEALEIFKHASNLRTLVGHPGIHLSICANSQG